MIKVIRLLVDPFFGVLLVICFFVLLFDFILAVEVVEFLVFLFFYFLLFMFFFLFVLVWVTLHVWIWITWVLLLFFVFLFDFLLRL